MIKIVEAYGDEDGKARGGTAGDQTGREIRVSTWYERDGGWDCYIECKDPMLADAAAYNANLIAVNEQYGYNQDDRWRGHKNIIKADGDIENAETGDYDCSSLVLSAYILAGLDVKAEGYTGNLERILLETGLFESYDDDGHILTDRRAKRGGMYLAAGHHVLMCLEDGDLAQDPPETIPDPIPVGKRYVESLGSVKLRVGHSTAYESAGTMYKGERLPYVATADETGWYAVDDGDRVLWISGNKKYTKIVGG